MNLRGGMGVIGDTNIHPVELGLGFIDRKQNAKLVDNVVSSNRSGVVGHETGVLLANNTMRAIPIKLLACFAAVPDSVASSTSSDLGGVAIRTVVGSSHDVAHFSGYMFQLEGGISVSFVT